MATIASLVLILASCATVPMAPPAEDAAAKKFEVPPGKALVYVFRNTSFGAAIRFDLSVNGKPIGKSARYTYFVVEAQPGPITIKAEAENTTEMVVNAEAGKIYWVNQEVRLGFIMARVGLTQVVEDEGRKAVAECQLASRVQM
jgi:hypothetical protein